MRLPLWANPPLDRLDLSRTPADAGFMLRLLGVFAMGEMLDWETPTDGYLLQTVFSTGVTAARAAIAHISQPSDV